MSLSFREYVLARRVTRTPTGDFVSDAKSDKDFPDVKSWDELESYLFSKAACSQAVAAGKEVWRGYRAKLRAA